PIKLAWAIERPSMDARAWMPGDMHQVSGDPALPDRIVHHFGAECRVMCSQVRPPCHKVSAGVARSLPVRVPSAGPPHQALRKEARDDDPAKPADQPRTDGLLPLHFAMRSPCIPLWARSIHRQGFFTSTKVAGRPT